jgi:hypothetical protein
VKRRGFLRLAGTGGLLAAGAAGVAESLAADAGGDPGTFEGKVWLTRNGAAYDGVVGTVRTHLERAFGEAFSSVRIERGPTVDVPTEDAAALMRELTWPRLLLDGLAGEEGLAPAPDLNLLVTDGDMSRAPTGIGTTHVAAVGGASSLAGLRPVAEQVLAYSDARRVLQVVVHEAGHALGLDHDHGSVREDGVYIVVSPMASTYPWTSGAVRSRQFDYDHGACGEPYPDATGRPARLQMSFSECALAELATYRGGLPVG